LLSTHSARDIYVVHEAEGERDFALECWIWAAGGKRHEFDWPERGKEPAEGVASWVTFAEYLALCVGTVSAEADDLGRDRDFGVRADDEAVKFQFHPTLPHEVPGGLIVHESAGEVAPAREDGVAEFPVRVQVADHGLADMCGARGEVRFFERAANECARAKGDELGGKV